MTTTSSRGGVKDLEVMLTNTIIVAFETAGSPQAHVEMLEAFQSMAQRESIKVSPDGAHSACQGHGSAALFPVPPPSCLGPQPPGTLKR